MAATRTTRVAVVERALTSVLALIGAQFSHDAVAATSHGTDELTPPPSTQVPGASSSAATRRADARDGRDRGRRREVDGPPVSLVHAYRTDDARADPLGCIKRAAAS